MTTVALALVALSASVQAAVPAYHVDFDRDQGATEFHAVGRPSALRINGRGDAPRGSVEVAGGKAKGVLTLDMRSLDSGISMRTRHMKEKYLETDKYPQARLTLAEIPLPASAGGGDFSAAKLPFRGTLLLHGVEKPVSGVADVSRHGDRLAVLASFGVKISDYAIRLPSFAGISVADEVSLDVRAEAPVVVKP